MGFVSFGYAIRNDNADVIYIDHGQCGHQSILQAEALGLRKGVKKVNELGFKEIEIEGDNLCIIRTMKNQWTCPWEIEIVITNTKLDLLSFSSVSFRHIFRDFNIVVDRAALLAHSIPVVGMLENDI